jgi:oligoribonuclease NrnB/cAMP/cGMP phosphodiesterase (DHH superfamily)
MTNTIIGYHDNCLDGFVAAMIAQTKAIYDGLPNIQMQPVNYNEPIFEAWPGDHVILVDFSFEPEVIERLRKRGVSITIVDHHETQIDKLIKGQFGKIGEQAAPNISYTCDCQKPNHNFFTGLVQERDAHGRGDYRAYLCDNREVSLMQRESGASMTWQLAIRKDPDFYKFAKTFMSIDSHGGNQGYELSRLVELVRTHDLYQHNGKLDHDATRLANWFKEWSGSVKHRRKLMQDFPNKSFEVFNKLKAEFLLTPMREKLEKGEAITQRMLRVIRDRCEKAKPFNFFHFAGTLGFPPGTRVGFIEGDFKDVSVSMAGNVLVKEYPFDVAVMIASEKNGVTTYSLRSDQFGKNIDVGRFCKELAECGVAIKGGGHRNSAGFSMPSESPFYLTVES